MLVRQAAADETARVASVLTAAARHLSDQGQPLWSEREVSEAAISEQVRAGRFHLALLGDMPVGAFRLDPEDPLFWPEVTDASTLFLHKLAVHPDHQGRNLSHALLGRACALTRGQGRGFLRLDCQAGRPKLRAVYERFGFRARPDVTLGKTVFHRFEFDVRDAAW